MLEQSQAKRIARSDFGRETSSSPRAASSPSPRVHDSLPSYGFEYDFVDVQSVSETKDTDEIASAESRSQKPGSGDGQTFEFRLFASPTGNTSSKATASQSRRGTTVKLLPTPDISDVPISEGRFVRPGRPETHYFTSSLAASSLQDLRREYTESAVWSNDILQKASSQWWPGTALPWRVMHIRTAKTKLKSGPSLSEVSATTEPAVEGSQRKKPNKKRRIQLRQLLLARTAAASAKVRQTETTEEKEKALREKKTAKNRKIQLKRREKERQKKAEAKIAISLAGEKDSEKAGDNGSE